MLSEWCGLSRLWRRASDQILCKKAFNIAKNSKYDGYTHRLTSMVYKNFDKKSSSGAVTLEIMSNYGLLDLATRQLAEELHKPIIKNSKNEKYTYP